MSSFEEQLGLKNSNTPNFSILDVFANDTVSTNPKQKNKSFNIEQHQYLKEKKQNDKVKILQKQAILTPQELRYQKNIQKAKQTLKMNQTKVYGPTIVKLSKDNQKTTNTTNNSNQQSHKEKKKDKKYTQKNIHQKEDIKPKRKISTEQPSIQKQIKHNQPIKRLNQKIKSSQSQDNESQEDWKAQLRKVTKYNPHDKKFIERDKYRIQQSNLDRMMAEEKISTKYGREEEQRQLERQKRLKELKHKKVKKNQ